VYEGATILMLDFQKKVDALRRYESLCFTICVTILIEEHASYKTAEQALCQLFGDREFWRTAECDRSQYILRVCTKLCMQKREIRLSRTS